VPCGQAWPEKIGSGASGVGHATTPARPNADGGIDFSSRTAPSGRRLLVAGNSAGYKVGDRQVGRARTRSQARTAVIGTLDCHRELVFPDTIPAAERRQAAALEMTQCAMNATTPIAGTNVETCLAQPLRILAHAKFVRVSELARTSSDFAVPGERPRGAR
jgi:hypothetical protein